MTTTEERLARLEGANQHLATKADVADLRAELKSDIGNLKADLQKWIVGLMLSSVALSVTLAIFIQRLID